MSATKQKSPAYIAAARRHDAKRGPPVALRLDKASMAMMAQALRPGESRSEFIRRAVMREIALRLARVMPTD
jgi:hypothetical protein